MAGHLAAVQRIFRIADELAQTLFQRRAADECRARLAVLRYDPILRLHRDRGPDDRRFLAERGTVEPDSTLALQGEHPVVEDALQDHAAIQADRIFFGQRGVQTGVCRAVVTDYTEGIEHAVPRTPRGPERQNYRGGLKPSYPGISKRFAPLSAW